MKKLAKPLLFLLLGSQTLLATADYILETYIPVANLQAELNDKEGIKLHKVPFLTYYSYEESSVGSVTWKYLSNSPHERLNKTNINLADIEGLNVALSYGDGEACTVLIDSSNVSHKYTKNEFEKILSYVKKATTLNLKNAKLKCSIEEKFLENIDVVTETETETESLPKPLALESVVNSVFSHYKSNYPQQYFLYDNIYLLGKSKSKIAYAIEYDMDPRDLLRVETFVQDLVSDKIVWKDVYEKSTSTNNVDFSSYWATKKDLIAQQLENYNLKPFDQSNLKQGSIHYENDALTLNSSSKESWSKEWGSNFLEHSTISLYSKLRGKKSVNHQEYKTPSHLFDRKPIGYITLNENNQRIAIVVAKVQRGWEGPPHNISYEFVGANLKVGFK